MALKPSLKPEQVKEVRKMLSRGKTQVEVARKFGVSQPTIHNITIGKTYRKVA